MVLKGESEEVDPNPKLQPDNGVFRCSLYLISTHQAFNSLHISKYIINSSGENRQSLSLLDWDFASRYSTY